MKLIIQSNRVAGTATDAYSGPDEFITAPADFDIDRMSEYVVADGVASIPLPVAPTSVTMRQARLALDAAGLLDTVEAAVAASPRAVQIEWEYAQTVDRAWPTLAALQAVLELTDEQIDGLFLAASTL